MKIAPIIKAVDKARSNGANIRYRLIHTGQHFDRGMSGDFFDQLGIPEPDGNLGAGGGTQAAQTASIMIGFEKELLENRPAVVVVVGDVTSTMACSITAKKLCVPVAHVEAGIRSGDMTMPEEINRIVTDSICDLFFTTSRTANEFLRKMGADADQIHFVGNTMIDTLNQNLHRIREPEKWNLWNVKERSYFLLTLHRPSNVDDSSRLVGFLETILDQIKDLSVIFPVHPRTRKILDLARFDHPRLIQIDPQGYLEFIFLLKNSLAVLTDSGGITEEATVLNIPCMTLRDTTERPETIIEGTNELVGTNAEDLVPYMQRLFAGEWKSGRIPELWDGRTADRIVNVLLNVYGKQPRP